MIFLTQLHLPKYPERGGCEGDSVTYLYRNIFL